MIRDDGPGGQGPPGRRPDVDDEGANDLDVLLRDAFRQAFVEDPPLDVGARHLWQLYRRAHRVGVRGHDRYEEQGRLRRVAVSASLSIIIIVFPGLLGQLSLDALPGDFLYPVKRHNETVALSTAVSWEDRDQMLVEQAERRLTEAQAVATLRPSEVLPAVNDVGAIMDELERSPVATTQAQVELIRGDFSHRLAALVDSISEPAKERIRVAVDEIVTADGIRSPPAAARQVGKTETAVDGQSGDDEHVAMAPQVDPPWASPDTDSSASVSARTSATPAGGPSTTPAGVPSSTSASPADAALPAPTVPSEVAISEAEALPSATTPSAEPEGSETEKCVPAVTTATVPGDATLPQTAPAASADPEPGASTAEVPGDESALSETSDPGTADACATADLPSPGEPTADLQPQGPSADDSSSEETDPVKDEDTDMPQTNVDGDALTPEPEQSPAKDGTSTRPADDEPVPAPVPRPGRATSEAEPPSPAAAEDATAHADRVPTQPADAGVSATP